MSELRASLIVAALLVPAAAPLGAQDPALARVRARADSLADEWRRAAAIADVADSLQRERTVAGRDTIAVGALRIIVNPSPLPVREAAALAWPVLDSLFGAAAQGLTDRPYVIHAFDPDTAARRPPLRVGMALPWNLTAAQLVHVLLANVPMPPPDTALGRWLGGPVRPAVRPELDRARVYVQLVTAPSQAARDCFAGALEACRAALGLDDAPNLFLRWYPSPLERRVLVTRSFAEYFNRGGTAPTLRACAAGRDDACTNLLESLAPGVIPKPLGVDARGTLVQTAVRLGGREAYGRLLGRPEAPIGERLAAAAGVASDTLLARWRSEVLASRPTTVGLSVWAGWAAAGWIALFALCGLRSSRWRLG